jgi:CRISPR-associated endonuclease Csy4
VQGQTTDIGVSFPQHVISRCQSAPWARAAPARHARALQRLMAQPWLKGMRDHTCKWAICCPVPANAQHRTVRRRQFKTNAERLRRRRMQRKGETAEQAAAAIPDTVERRPELPFVQLRSSSTGQSFCLCVEHGPTASQPASGL